MTSRATELSSATKGARRLTVMEIRAINEVGLFQYLEKPWDNEDLLHIIEDGLNRRLAVHRLQEYSRELEARVRGLESDLAKLKKQG